MSQNKEHLDLVAATLTAGALPALLGPTTLGKFKKLLPPSNNTCGEDDISAAAIAATSLFSEIRKKLEGEQNQA